MPIDEDSNVDAPYGESSDNYHEQEPIAEAPQHPVVYYRSQGKSPIGGNQYPVPGSMATGPSREDQAEDEFDESLVPYHRLGITDPDDIRDLALISGGPAHQADIDRALGRISVRKKVCEKTQGSIIGYHGSRAPISKLKPVTDAMRVTDFGPGMYFTTDPQDASKYGKFVYKAELSVKNPLVVSDEMTPEMLKVTKALGISDEDLQFADEGLWHAIIGLAATLVDIGQLSWSRLIGLIKKLGHDGIRIPSTIVKLAKGNQSQGDYIVVFDTAQMNGWEELRQHSLSETLASSVALACLPCDPPGKNVCAWIRGQADRYSKVAVCLYPGSIPFEGMQQALQVSLPDVVRKLQIHAIASKSLASAIDVAQLGSVKPGHPVDVFVPGPWMDRAVAERDEGKLGVDPTVIRIQAAQVPVDNTPAIQSALAQPTELAARRLLDPHVFSDPQGFSRFKQALGESLRGSLRLEFLRDISPNDDREEGAARIEEIVEANRQLLAQRGVGIDGMRFLGKGNNGLAWELKDGRVLKVTTDDAEAHVASHLKGKRLRHVFQIDDVWAFPGQFNGHHVYGLITEAGLEKPSGDERADFTWMIKMLTGADDSLEDRLFGGDLRPLLQRMMSDQRMPGQTKREVLEQVKRFDLPGICADAKRVGVKFDVHAGNLMRRKDGTYVIIDIGTGGDQEGAKPPFIAEAGIGSYPQNSQPRGGQYGRGGGQSGAWSSGRLVLRAPQNHVPVDDNEDELQRLDTQYGVNVNVPDPEDIRPRSTVRHHRT